MAFDIDGWYNEMKKDGDVIAHHKGSITAELITKVLECVENELNTRGERSKLRKKVYNVMVEALQNLFHHTENIFENRNSKENDKNFAIFVLKKEENDYSFISGNYVVEERVKFLKDRLDQINYLTLKELKLLYQLILNNDEYSDKGGGGLGLVDIAKRTGQDYEYSFHNSYKGGSFFCLKILIKD